MRVLVYRIGSLGDTLVSIPALHVIRKRFPDAEITLVSDEQRGRQLVSAKEILGGSGLIDRFLQYPVSSQGRPMVGGLINIWSVIRNKHFDWLIYLGPSNRPSLSEFRDWAFFRLAGIRKIAGMDRMRPLDLLDGNGKMIREADYLLRRLATSGWEVPALNRGDPTFQVDEASRDIFDHWVQDQPADGGRPWIGLGMGASIPAKRWPPEGFVEVVRRLIAAYDIWPVALGGAEDRDVSEAAVRDWGRGYVAAGKLSVGASALALSKCVLYLGNDTGTAHLAASQGIRCVAVFSSRSMPCNWFPYGEGHIVLRTSMDCEGCELTDCHKYPAECIAAIGVENVLKACEGILREKDSRGNQR